MELQAPPVWALVQLVDEWGYLSDAYGLEPGDWVLVRPDGYVGAIVSSGEIAALETYLQSMGLKRGRLCRA